eukprot:m.56093 g.56093  ORF g.56093 m.56093 type:complete len:74 (+) comp34549_c0_seq2:110-331(+)
MQTSTMTIKQAILRKKNIPYTSNVSYNPAYYHKVTFIQDFLIHFQNKNERPSQDVPFLTDEATFSNVEVDFHC